MHELSICRSIVDIVDRHAAGREVRIVHLQVGALRQIVPDTLVYCWALMNADTPLASSELRVESIPGAIRCRPCDRRQSLAESVLICGNCGGQDVEIVAGEEFLITTLDLAEA
ncbi:hydrogenase maturation nickel metallochaperone HypA [Pseudonocardia abyssalis]|uniref:Hydrogenase maturation factor HypA n=1 Tax=Pseudonocardia abyssalis TaxID=2792008 RepID=A0ABS6UV01_9PSEU|nr:hydrogenase maturation nickel metallochaperone HypA [Pseudonocardia abyssalis]MBW0116770.1 hydrogenase maturation nickel metallochaperone HypA [Pseudonocardia abyssalis]MBW0136090.1 hydrogenase maturation nickel metallochaperone HypA [Pseudonocardia abyssalis]